MKARARAGLAFWLWGLLILVACGNSQEPTTQRFLSAFSGPERNWVPEDDLEIAPQKAPMMRIYETTQYGSGELPDASQRAAADELHARSLEAARRNGWFDFERARASGYELMFGDEVHYVNEAHVLDSQILDPERPEFLMFYDTPTGKELVGAMFYTRKPLDHGPQVGGPLTVWHFHTWNRKICLLSGLLSIGLPDESGHCSLGVPGWRSPEMLHVWFLDHPDGRFGTTMKLPRPLLRELLQKRRRQGAKEETSPVASES
ncbi:hypothetical protein MK489_01565 [Myxococcota bacterium]|nr:hypothetical protein [Myxococcota bacterium]